ncbi:MAG: hypothetical protein ABSA21_03255 [Candidatus Limnocylindrales bacterium]
MRLSGTAVNVKWAAGTAAVAVCLIASAGHIAAAPQFSGSEHAGLGTPTRVETALAADADTALFAREVETRDALGFPVGVKRIGRHVLDGFEHAEYDEVTEVDSAGKVQAVTQFDSRGHLRAAVRLDAAPASKSRVTRDGAVRSAQKSARAAGLDIGTPTSTQADQATGGWTVHWARMQAGVRVRGDETRVQVWPDGRIQSVARAEHDLAAAPVQRIGSDAARQVASANLDSWSAGRNSGYAIQNVYLEWVGPNAAFDPDRATADEAPYRLAWVAEVKPFGDAANYAWLISLFIDAGDGSIIGGDLVE